jgi:hypothetical protein
VARVAVEQAKQKQNKTGSSFEKRLFKPEEKQKQTHAANAKLTHEPDTITCRATPSESPKNQWRMFAVEQAEQKQNKTGSSFRKTDVQI